jgi:hypothetical protein
MATADIVMEYFTNLSSVPVLIGRAAPDLTSVGVGGTATVAGGVALALLARGSGTLLINGAPDDGADNVGEADGA